MDINNMATHEIAQYLKENRHTAFILWQKEDVIHSAKDNFEIDLPEKVAEEILDSLNRIADCEHGITWEHIYQELYNHLNK
jgi:hypothetical protein